MIIGVARRPRLSPPGGYAIAVIATFSSLLLLLRYTTLSAFMVKISGGQWSAGHPYI